jgi:hypothetical protein
MTDKRIGEVINIIAENPGMNRTQLSRLICREWGWQSPGGHLKEISCRDMLRALDKAGAIKLPPPMIVTRVQGQRSKIQHLDHSTAPVECRLKDQLPLNIQIAGGKRENQEFKSYIAQFHYLGFDRTVGENMKYLVFGCSGTPLACLLFGSAAWSCASRDRYIGWGKGQRAKNLMYLTANTRFLIFPWVRVPYLASHVLSIVMRRVSQDWESRYGHSLYAVETYVDTSRFRGTAYRAANWIYVGRTTGRGRDGGHHHAILPEKDIYLFPLHKNFRRWLGGAPC